MKKQKRVKVPTKNINFFIACIVIGIFLLLINVFALIKYLQATTKDLSSFFVAYATFCLVFIAIIAMIVTNYRSYKRLRSYTLTDIFTGLANKHRFIRITNRYIATHRQVCFLIVWFDILNFHLINQRYGREVGDDLLLLVSAYLKVNKHIYAAARVEGDNFAVLIEKCEEGQADTVVTALMLALKKEAALAKNINIDFVAGACIYDKDIDNGEDILEKAHIAQNIARDGHKPIAFFNEDVKNMLLEEDKVAEEIRRGLKNNEFKVYYQPKYNIVNGEMVGAEALIRWQHPQHGLLLPGRFLSIATKKGLLNDIDHFAFEQICKDIQKWHTRCMYVPISVNSEKDIFINEKIFASRFNLIEEYNIDKGDIQFEITERTAIEDVGRVSTILQEVRRRGFTIAIDDFGTGYSSLSMLRSLPIDTIKLDKSFIKKVMLDDMDRKIISSFVEIFNALGLEAVAEGVETLEELAFLKECGITCVQGFLLDFPLKEQVIFERFKKGEMRLVDKDVLEIITTLDTPLQEDYDKESSSFFYRNILIKGEIDFIEVDLTSNLIIYNGITAKSGLISTEPTASLFIGKSYTLASSFFIRNYVAEKDKKNVALFLSRKNLQEGLASGIYRDSLRFNLKKEEEIIALGELSVVLIEENNRTYAIIKYKDIQKQA